MSLVFSCVVIACDPETSLSVSSTTDGAEGSLRAQIAAANRADTGTSITIEVPPGTYDLTRCGADDDNAAGDLDLTTIAPVTLRATGPDVVVRQTCAGERVLERRGAGRLILVGLTVSGGSLAGVQGAEAAEGGGVRAAGDVTLTRVTLSANSASGAPASAASDSSAAVGGGDARGGALFVGGSLTATDSSFASNTASGGAGVPSLADAPPTAGGIGVGGGAFVTGAITLERVSFTENTAASGHAGGEARGGALAQSAVSPDPVTLTGVTAANNRVLGANNSGRAPRTEFSGAAAGGAFATAGALKAKELTATNNVAIGGNSSGPAAGARGGAIAATGAVTIESSTIAANRARGGAGELFCPEQCGTFCAVIDGSGAFGGALWTTSTVVTKRATFADNTADIGEQRCSLRHSCNPFPGPRDTIWQCTSGGPTSGGAVWTTGAVTIEGGEYRANAGVVAVASEGDGTIVGAHVHDNAALHFDGDLVVEQAQVVANGALESRSLVLRGGRMSGNGGVTVGGDMTLSDTEFSGHGLVEVSGSIDATRVPMPNNWYVISHRDVHLREVSFTGSSGLLADGDATLNTVNLSGNFERPLVVGGRASLVNTTAHGNGGPLQAGHLDLEHTTISDGEFGPQFLISASTLTSKRSVAVRSSPYARVCGDGVRVLDSAYNWFSDATCDLSGVGDRTERAAFVLAPPADNGGPVPTQRLGAGSVLVDRVPTDACPIPSDARGVSRPQGSACDMGAFERELSAVTGPSNFSVAFEEPPATVTAGERVELEVVVTNRGRVSSPVTVVMRIPTVLMYYDFALTPDSGARCTQVQLDNTFHEFTCELEGAIAPSASTRIRIQSTVPSFATERLDLTAELAPGSLSPPFDDDHTTLDIPVLIRTGVVARVTFDNLWAEDGDRFVPVVSVALRNTGPSWARATPDQPFYATFHAAPGVHARRFGTEERIERVLAPADPWFVIAYFAITVDGAIPAHLGTVEVEPGVYPQPDLLPVPVNAADVAITAESPAGSAGSGRPFGFEIVNHGPAAASGIVVSLESTDPSAVFSDATPALGSFEPSADGHTATWNVPVLAPDQVVSLAGAISGAGELTVSARVRSGTIDWSTTNDEATFAVTPAAGLSLETRSLRRMK